jgi:carbamoyl-phosphate synthase large subunit
MPRNSSIKTILVIGSGPIVIGQACEFDYAGTQAIRALKEEGYRVVLINSNPATIMTDPDLADKTYIEPLTVEFVEEVIKIERPDALLPTMGGQTALNLALDLDEKGILTKYNCSMIGANAQAIKTAEDRALFRAAMEEIGLESARSKLVTSVADAELLGQQLGYPLVLRPSRTLGGSGGGLCGSIDELREKVEYALSVSPNREVLVEESLLGWKEIELEVMRDSKDNVVIICGIENLDPLGVHTGDSITVAPIQTLTDKEYQILRNAAVSIIRKIGVDTGGSNVQFAVHPKTGRIIVIEMNPRVSRSSALASKATGFPIAKIAAKLAVGYSLNEIRNDITLKTPASFEPTIDYVVVKIPRFNFEKFDQSDTTLGTQMKAIGEVMSIGRSFKESLQKALCSLELGSFGFDRGSHLSSEVLLNECKRPSPERIWYLGEALRRGHSVDRLGEATGVDLWFLRQIQEIVDTEKSFCAAKVDTISAAQLKELKMQGMSDARLARMFSVSEQEIRLLRERFQIFPQFKTVDTCAGEFQASTPYLYSCYEYEECSLYKTKKEFPKTAPTVVVLGSGPNRIGQGVEFDYACVQGVQSLRALGYRTVMINCNPETVSTDYDISDALYFEPLTLEAVLEIVRVEQPVGVVVQLGGQTPLKLMARLHAAGVPILGTQVLGVDIAEDRELFNSFIKESGLKQPKGGAARTYKQAQALAAQIGYPVMVRPSFVLGGRSMRVLRSDEDLATYVQECVVVSEDRPILIDKFLDGAKEVDVDALCDGRDVQICGVMEQVEEAGIHSGDSFCYLPPQTLSKEILNEIVKQATEIALGLNVKGLLNIQFAVLGNELYILEANPRASRTIPFVSKATGVSWVDKAIKVIMGLPLLDVVEKQTTTKNHVCVKGCVFPFGKFPGVDTKLSPEMRSTGEVMGIGETAEIAFAKAHLGAGNGIVRPRSVCLLGGVDDRTVLCDLSDLYRQSGVKVFSNQGTVSILGDSGAGAVVCSNSELLKLVNDEKIDLLIEASVYGDIDEPFLKSLRIASSRARIPSFSNRGSIAALQRTTRAIVDGAKICTAVALQG